MRDKKKKYVVPNLGYHVIFYGHVQGSDMCKPFNRPGVHLFGCGQQEMPGPNCRLYVDLCGFPKG